MGELVLETDELSWLLAAMHAKALVGLEDSPLFPADVRTQEATWRTGVLKLMQHRWLAATGKPGEVRPNDDLACLVAVLAEPEFVISTIRSSPAAGRRMLLHYFSKEAIIELTSFTAEQYHLGVVPDPPALWMRIGEMLDLPGGAGAGPAVQFSTNAQTLTEMRQRVADGQRKEAASLLGKQGLSGADGESFLGALDALIRDDLGMIVVARACQGRVAAEQKATVLRHGERVWLIHRPAAESAALTVGTVAPDTVGRVVTRYFELLKAQPQ